MASTDTPNLAIVMPAFNEGPSISAFLREIFEEDDGNSVRVIVVDDFSSDDTAGQVEKLKDLGFDLELVSNPINLGHGPSTLIALREGLKSGATTVVAADGDGQVRASDLYKLARSSRENQSLVEGVRKGRSDPWFRKFTSLITRLLVWSRVGLLPADANTPFRAYPALQLGQILEEIPPSSTIPNLLISAWVRSRALPALELPISVFIRQGTVPSGVTWKQRFQSLPSRRFLKFIFRAVSHWYQFEIGPVISTTSAQRISQFVAGRRSLGRYASIGFSGLTLDLVVYFALITVGIGPIVSSAVGSLTGITNNFLWNSILNFRTQVVPGRGAKFLAVGLAGLIVSALLVGALTSMEVSPFLAKIVTIPAVVALQFLANRFWTFSRLGD